MTATPPSESPPSEGATLLKVPDHDPVLGPLIRALLAALEPPQSASLLFLQQWLRVFQTHVLQTYGRTPEADPTRNADISGGALSPLQERHAKDYLGSHGLHQLSVDALALTCGLPPSHFRKAFKAATGQTPHQWARQHRLAQAVSLLQTNKTLPEVASACGFADVPHLTRFFRRQMGCSPTVWRRQMR